MHEHLNSPCALHQLRLLAGKEALQGWYVVFAEAMAAEDSKLVQQLMVAILTCTIRVHVAQGAAAKLRAMEGNSLLNTLGSLAPSWASWEAWSEV